MSTSIISSSVLSGSPSPMLQMFGLIARGPRTSRSQSVSLPTNRAPCAVLNRAVSMPASTSSAGCDALISVEQLRCQIDQLSRRVFRLDRKIDDLREAYAGKRYRGTYARPLQALSKQLRNVVTASRNGGGGLDVWLAADAQEIGVAAHTPTEKDVPVCMLTSSEVDALTEMYVDLAGIKTPVLEAVSSVPVVALLQQVDKARVQHERPPLEMSPGDQRRLDALQSARVEAQNRLHRLQEQLLEQVMPQALKVQFQANTRNHHWVTTL